MTTPAPCPSRLALCGVPCGCAGQNPSHYPRRGPLLILAGSHQLARSSAIDLGLPSHPGRLWQSVADGRALYGRSWIRIHRGHRWQMHRVTREFDYCLQAIASRGPGRVEEIETQADLLLSFTLSPIETPSVNALAALIGGGDPLDEVVVAHPDDVPILEAAASRMTRPPTVLPSPLCTPGTAMSYRAGDRPLAFPIPQPDPRPRPAPREDSNR